MVQRRVDCSGGEGSDISRKVGRKGPPYLAYRPAGSYISMN